MTREIIKIADEKQWLALRENDITSTMTPALFGLSPYITKFELYHAKKSNVHVPFITNDRVEKGKRMENYAAMEVGYKMGMDVLSHDDYIRIPEDRMGSSFDYEIFCPNRGPGILEIKAVDYFQYKMKWDENEAPEHIEIQLQHQLECADKYSWGVIAVFTGIYDFVSYERERDREMGSAIRSTIKRFWSEVDQGIEPPVDYFRDSEVINELYRGKDTGEIDKTGDEQFEGLLAKYSRLKDGEKEISTDLTALKSQIHSIMADKTKAFTERYKLTAGWTKDSPATIITEDMVGNEIGGRRGYRQLLIKDLTTKKGK